MAKRELPSPELLRQLFRYDPETGKLYRRPRPVTMFRESPYLGGTRSAQWLCNAWNSAFAGGEVASNGYGYRVVSLYGLKLQAHRVIWAMVHDKWPDGEIDHINGIRDDNRIGNLRDIPKAANQRNMKLSRANTSGVTGVYLHRASGLWHACISPRGKKISVGYFKSLDDAREAVERRRAEMGFDPRHGTPGPSYPNSRRRHLGQALTK